MSLSTTDRKLVEHVRSTRPDRGAALDAALETLVQRPDATLAQLLVERGLMSADEASRLRRSVDLTVPIAPPSQDVERGAQVTGSGSRYDDVREINRGGMGAILGARCASTGREVALKVLRAGAGASAAEVGKFLAEARITARLEHPAIVPVHELWQRATKWARRSACWPGSCAGRCGSTCATCAARARTSTARCSSRRSARTRWRCAASCASAAAIGRAGWPTRPALYAVRGRVRWASRDLAGAEADYSRALELSPEHFEVLVNRASLRIEREDFGGAIRDLERALTIQPRSWLVWANTACAHALAGDREATEAALARAIAIRAEVDRRWR